MYDLYATRTLLRTFFLNAYNKGNAQAFALGPG